jgi:hypothetical protein
MLSFAEDYVDGSIVKTFVNENNEVAEVPQTGLIKRLER